MPQNPHNLTAEYATSDSDIRHNLIFSGEYRLPFGKGQTFGANWGPLANSIASGWKFGGIFSNGDLESVKTLIKGNPNLARGTRNILEYFDTAAFSEPAIPSGASYAYGNAGRNLIAGPGYINVDGSLAKEYTLENRWTLQLRAEAFNGMNSVHYSNPDGDFNSGTFGQINHTMGDNRKAQLAAKFIF